MQTATAEGGGGAVPVPHGAGQRRGGSAALGGGRASSAPSPTPRRHRPRALPRTGCEMSALRCALGAVVPPLSTASALSPARKMSPAEARRPPTTPGSPREVKGEGAGGAGPFRAALPAGSCGPAAAAAAPWSLAGTRCPGAPRAEGQSWKRRARRPAAVEGVGAVRCRGTGAPHSILFPPLSPSLPLSLPPFLRSPAVRAVCPGGWRCPGCRATEGRVWCGRFASSSIPAREGRRGRRAAQWGCTVTFQCCFAYSSSPFLGAGACGSLSRGTVWALLWCAVRRESRPVAVDCGDRGLRLPHRRQQEDAQSLFEQ